MKQLSPEAIDMLELRVGKCTVQSWFNSVKVQYQDGACTIVFPSHFVKSWIRTNYGEDLDQVIRATYGVDQVSFAVDKEISKGASLVSEYSMLVDSKMLFSNFVVGESNKTVYMAAERVGKDPICNPLFVYGRPGHGKSHILQAVANRFMSQGKKVCYISAEQYMLLFVKSIKDKETIKFKNSLRNVDLLLVDDLQFIQGKDTTQEELFYNFTHILSQNGWVIVAADRPPQEMKIDPRIKTRISAGLILGIDDPSSDLKIKILTQKAKQYRKSIDPEIIQMITKNIQGSIRELEGALLRICAQIEFFGDKMNTQNAEGILSDILMEKRPRTIEVEDIIRAVERFYDCDLTKVSRERKFIKARQIAMYLSRKMKNCSLPFIAERFGLRHHTNVFYANKKMEEQMKSDRAFHDEVMQIKNKLEKGFE